MESKCGESVMCQEFTSLSSSEVHQIYQEEAFQTLRYSAGFQLPFTQAYTDGQRKNVYNIIYQTQRLENGSELSIQVKYITLTSAPNEYFLFCLKHCSAHFGTQ